MTTSSKKKHRGALGKGADHKEVTPKGGRSVHPLVKGVSLAGGLLCLRHSWHHTLGKVLKPLMQGGVPSGVKFQKPHITEISDIKKEPTSHAGLLAHPIDGILALMDAPVSTPLTGLSTFRHAWNAANLPLSCKANDEAAHWRSSVSLTGQYTEPCGNTSIGYVSAG